MSIYDGPLASDDGNLYGDDEHRSRSDWPVHRYVPSVPAPLPSGQFRCMECGGVYLLAETSNPMMPHTMVDPVTLRYHKITCRERKSAGRRLEREAENFRLKIGERYI